MKKPSAHSPSQEEREMLGTAWLTRKKDFIYIRDKTENMINSTVMVLVGVFIGIASSIFASALIMLLEIPPIIIVVLAGAFLVYILYHFKEFLIEARTFFEASRSMIDYAAECGREVSEKSKRTGTTDVPVVPNVKK